MLFVLYNEQNMQNIYNHLSFHTGRYFLVSAILWFITVLDVILLIIFAELYKLDQYHNPFFYLFNLLYGIKPVVTLWYYRRKVYIFYYLLLLSLQSYVNFDDNYNSIRRNDGTFPQLPANDLNIIAEIQRQLISILLEGMQV